MSIIRAQHVWYWVMWALLAAPPQVEARSQAIPHPGIEIGCDHCHICPNPTAEDTCLRVCTRPRAGTSEVEAATEIPDFFLLGELSDIYVPVLFPHKLHADMEGMAQGCDVCHHYNPPGPILKCKECHGGPSNPQHLGQPSLKGAYHRQCLGCHREWSHDTDCAVCHAKRTAGQVIETSLPDKTDIVGRLHPNIEAPDTWVYRIEDMDEGGVVTFHHREHVELFGLACVDCHKMESCGRCHDAASRAPHVREDPHEDCLGCHDVENDCAHCHADRETKGFDHAQRSGFLLKDYHKGLSCNRCHLEPKVFTGLGSKCENCHTAGWEPEEFDHSKTGIRLDEIHVEAACADCHTAGWGKPTTCAECHDDSRSYPNSSPGVAVPLGGL
jgi:hypothetical protein